MKNTKAEKNKACHSRGMLSGIYNACRCKIGKDALLNGYVEDPRLDPALRPCGTGSSGMTAYFTTARGFTLIELLVVVLIIGILAAVAVPQYQKAVLKSRYAALMPIAKAMSDSNEAYFLAHGNYASNAQDLPVQGLNSYPDGTELEFGTTPEYSYVLATRDNDFPNNYIVYQKHSEQFPGEIHCEALKGNTQAAEVCQSFGATENKGVILNSTHDTWLLSGTGHGVPPEVDAGLDDALTEDETDEPVDPYSCDKALALGYTCVPDKEHGKKTVCTTVNDKTYCRTKTYDENGGYSSKTCETKTDSYGRTYCTDKSTKIFGYDEDGKKLWELGCSSSNNSGSCAMWGLYSYEYDGNRLTAKKTCFPYDVNTAADAIPSKSLNANGSCKKYISSAQESEVYTYDNAAGTVTTRRCLNADTGTGDCTSYQDSNRGVTVTFYEGKDKTKERYCFSVNESGTCSSYSASLSYGYGFDYKYDPITKGTLKLYCKALDTDGVSCKTYSSNTASLSFYDDKGNLTRTVSCVPSADFSTCDSYSNSSVSYTYLSDGDDKNLYSIGCAGADLNVTTGECSAYSYNSIQWE